MKKKTNWWAILAVILIGVPVGYVGMGLYGKIFSDPFLSVNVDKFDIKSEGDEVSFDINSNVNWKVSIEDEPDWLSAEPEDGSKSSSVILKANGNPDIEKREATVKVTWTDGSNNKQEVNILVTQEAKEPEADPNPPVPPVPDPDSDKNYLNIVPSSKSFDAKGGMSTIAIQSNTDWKVTTSGSDGWLEVGSMDGNGNKNISLNAKENTTDKNRSATLTLSWKDEKGKSQKTNVSVTQKGVQQAKKEELYLSVKSENVSFNDGGGNIPVTVKSNTSWTVSATGDNWLTIGSKEGNGNKTINLKAARNTSTSERGAEVTFTWKDNNGESKRTVVKVVQKSPAPYFSITQKGLSYDAQGGDKSLTVKSNTDWNATTDANWLSVGNTTGKGDKTLAVNAAKNPGKSERSAKITFTWKDGKGATQKTTVVVSQVKLTQIYFDVTPQNVSFQTNGRPQSVSVKTNASFWDLTTAGGDWLKAKKAGKGVTVTAEKNSTYDQRTGAIKFSWKDENGTTQTKDVTVTQMAAQKPTLYVKPAQNVLSFSKDKESKTISVNSNTSWDVAATGGKWLSVKKNDNGNGVIVTAESNTAEKRSGTVRFSWKDENGTTQTKDVTVTQAAQPVEVLTLTEAQKIVEKGTASSNIPDNCPVTGNGVNTTYGDFRKDVVSGKYSSVKVVAPLNTGKDGNATKINVKVTLAPTCLSKDEAQRIINANKKSEKIPETCIIVINGKSQQYKKFRDGVDFGYYSNVKVTDVKCDAKGVVTNITVSATVNGGD